MGFLSRELATQWGEGHYAPNDALNLVSQSAIAKKAKQ